MTSKDYPSMAVKVMKEFVADIKNGIFTDPADITDLCLVEFALGKMSPSLLMDNVVTHVLPHKQKIFAKDIKFFIEKKDQIFAGLPEDRVTYFANVITAKESQGGISDENKELVWSYFEILVSLAEKYKKER
ncbi:MAG TPA: hypothetical protein VFM18_20840 [Methanosarcina sp.]|nr:hypothetical protein [Methanosarcina sp.]